MLPDLANLAHARPDERPPGFGLTLAAKARGGPAELLLSDVKSAWGTIAAWGRWSDEDLPDLPSDEECLQALPEWLRTAFGRESFEDWHYAVVDARDWIWWSGALVGAVVKIDVSAGSMPTSLWMLEFVVESAGGEIVYQGDWIDGATAARL